MTKYYKNYYSDFYQSNLTRDRKLNIVNVRDELIQVLSMDSEKSVRLHWNQYFSVFEKSYKYPGLKPIA